MSDIDQRKIFWCLGNRQGRHSYCPIGCNKDNFEIINKDTSKFKPLKKEKVGRDHHWFLVLSPSYEEDREFYIALPLTHKQPIKNGIEIKERHFGKDENGYLYFKDTLPSSIVLFDKVCKIHRKNIIRRLNRKQRNDGTFFSVDYDGLLTKNKYNEIISVYI